MYSLISSRQRSSNDDGPKDEREDYHNCSVLYCARQLCTVIRTHTRISLQFLKLTVGLVFSLDLGLLFVCFCHFYSCVVCFCCILALVSSVLSQEISQEERFQNLKSVTH